MVGISLVFLSIDLLGGVWSLLSLVFAPPPFDPLAAVSYSSVVILELGIFLLAAILNPRYYRRERERKAALAEEERAEDADEEPAEERTEVEKRTGDAADTSRTDTGVTAVASRVATPGTTPSREGGFGWMAHEGEDIEQALEGGLRRIRSSRSGRSLTYRS